MNKLKTRKRPLELASAIRSYKCALPPVALSILVMFVIFSAGCISLGPTTTDVMMGNESIGTIKIIPQDNNTFDAEIEIFGMKITKDGLSKSEADSLSSSLSSGNFLLDDLFVKGIPTDIPTGIPLNLSLLTDFSNNTLPTNLSLPVDTGSFDLDGVKNTVNESLSGLKDLLPGMF